LRYCAAEAFVFELCQFVVASVEFGIGVDGAAVFVQAQATLLRHPGGRIGNGGGFACLEAV